MSTIVDKKPKKFKKFHIERFDSAMEMAQTCKTRPITDSRFDDKSKETFGSFEGVSTYQDALDLLSGGYQPTVDAMRGVFKAGVQGSGNRFAFQNSVVGFAPVVPLALKNVPNSMIGMTMKPIKCKVVDVYYDMTCSCGTDSKDIIEAGRKLLSAVIELERQGYRFNLYAVQGYNDNTGCDMAVVKVKSATQPLDLKRISFPLTHTAFFRVIGFDWYSKVPGGKYRGGYGHALAYDYNNEQMQELGKELFGANAIFFTAVGIMKKDTDHIKEVVTNGKGKN